MICDNDRAAVFMARADFVEVREAFVARARAESGRNAILRGVVREAGYEQVSVDPAALLTPDGREVLRLCGRAWALTPAIHAARSADALAQAKQMAVAAQQGSEPSRQAGGPATCTALIDGQLCGGTLVMAPVCPRCALGKSGVAATLTCDVCGHVTAIMREAK